MATLFSYIKKYKDVPLDKDNLNIIDALILTGVIYLPLPSGPSGKLTSQDTLECLLQKFIDSPKAYKDCVMPLTDLKLARTLVKAKRFKDIKMYGYHESINNIEQKQFRAATYLSDNLNQMFISFCGTDTTLVGWKEDFNLSFKKNVPSQIEAVQYLEAIAKKFPKTEIFIGGHSKGGNLAMYAATYCKKEVKERIKYCFNFDGPGLLEEDIASEEYQLIRDRIISIIPNYSVIGILLGFSDDYRIIKSFGIGIYNHAFYYWNVNVENKEFIYTNKLSGMSAKTAVVINKALKEFDNESKRILMDSIYKMLTAGGATTTHAVNKNFLETLEGASLTYKSLPEETRLKIVEIISSIGSNYLRPLNDEEKIARKFIEDHATKK